MRNQRIQIMVELALCVAVSTVLNFIRLPISIAGGSISMVMLPIAIIALRRGPLVGATAGCVFGLLDLLMDPYILAPAQVLLDYPVPYLLFGLGVGIFHNIYRADKVAAASDAKNLWAKMMSRRIMTIVFSTIFGAALRYVSHVLSGVLFFAEYAPAGQNVWAYSLIYNATYIVGSLMAIMWAAMILMPILDNVAPVPQTVSSIGSASSAS